MSNSSGLKPGTARRVAAQLRPYWGSLALILVIELCCIPLALLLPVPLALAVDSLMGSRSMPLLAYHFVPAGWPTQRAELVIAAALLIAAGLLQHILGFSSWLLQTYTSERMILGFRSQIFQHVQRLSLSFHDRKGTGDTTYRIQYDAPALSQIALKGVVPTITATLTLLGMLYITARIDWRLALIALVMAPCLFVVTRKYSGRVHSEWTEVRARDSNAMSVLNETLGALRVVKAFGQERREFRRFLSQSNRYVRGQMKLALLQSSFYVLVGLIIVSASAVALVVGVHHVRSGLLTVGSLLLVMAYLGKLYEPLATLSGKFVEVQAAFVSVGRAFALLDELPEVVEPVGAKALQRAAGAISFRNVSFHYDSRKPLLRNVTLNLPAGAHIGILGHSGAGKTTLVSLLTRLYDPSGGHILLDGVDLREYRLADLRDQFSIVLQEPVLFSTTIADNIAYTQPAASRAEVIRAAQQANAHDFIMRLPNGYDTQVGARGASLSGGERQRIALARAFLKDAPILILDEPTSSVDSATEAGIVEAAGALMQGRTTFVITHRPNTLQHCELQFELKGGQLLPLFASACDRDESCELRVVS